MSGPGLVDEASDPSCRHKHQQAISGIIYLHRSTEDGSQSPDVDRNLSMLSRIAGDSAMRNVVVATDRWEQIASAAQEVLQGLFSFPSQFKRYDGTKLSAFYIMHSVLKKTLEPLRIQIELGTDEETDEDLASTTAGQELIKDINELITVKQAEDRRIRREMAVARRAKDRVKVAALDAELAALGPVLERLKAEQIKVEASVDWNQAEIVNTALDKAVSEWHELVTTDWKVKYEELLIEHNQLKATKGRLSLGDTKADI
jgi:hypothetical protein